jgi:hypothetical protein
MFNTFIPVAKPPSFGTSQREVADLADRIRGLALQRGVVPHLRDVPLEGVNPAPPPAAPMAHISVTEWEAAGLSPHD